MANKNTKTAEQAAATPGAAAQPAPTPPAGQAAPEAGQKQEGDAEQGAEPDYRVLYEEAANLRDEYAQQVQTIGGELRTVAAERDAALNTVPRFYEPYEALTEEELNTVLEIVLAVAHDRGIVTTPEQGEAEPETSTEPGEVDPHAETKALLKRLGLPCAYQMPDGSIQFDAKHVRTVVGAEAFDSLTVISAE